MNRTEFLAALSLRLQDISADEKDEAVKYYSEYLDEVGVDGEEAAIAELGGAEKVANIIRANCGAPPLSKQAAAAANAASSATPELTLDAPLFADAPHAPTPQAQQATYAECVSGQAASYGTPEAPYAPCDSSPQQNNNRILWIIILVLTFPIWIGLLGGLMGVVFGILGALIAFVASGFGLMVGGFVAFWGSVAVLSTSVANGLATMGFCLLLFALGSVITSLSVWALGKGIPFFFTTIGRVVRAIFGKVGA